LPAIKCAAYACVYWRVVAIGLAKKIRQTWPLQSNP
jgi:hypothetical protein